MATVKILDEVTSGKEGETRLCFQKVMYFYDKGSDPLHESGYRFIWRDAGDRLLPQRGQARIETIEEAEELIKMAKKRKWE